MDHPRACGVYLAPLNVLLAAVGSSPRVRGLHVWSVAITDYWRIIPARAGFTVSRRRISIISRDHPRACGVYCLGSTAQGFYLGSSPRVRGLLDGY